MKNLQKSSRTEALKILREMSLNKNLTETTRRAIRVRLQVILDEEVRNYSHWNDVIKEKMNLTRQKQVSREFKKRIQALRIVIHALTPFFERTCDVPTFVIKKNKERE